MSLSQYIVNQKGVLLWNKSMTRITGVSVPFGFKTHIEHIRKRSSEGQNKIISEYLESLAEQSQLT